MNSRPKLSVSLAKSLKAGAESRGFLAYFPFVFATCLTLGFVAAEYVPISFWADGSWDVSTAVFGGMLAFNGLLMSLGWFAFSKIYEILANERLGKMLTENKLLDVHLAFIDVSHIVLIAASCLSVVGLVVILAGMPLWMDEFLFGACLGLTLYGLARAFSATKMMNDLVWEQAHLDRSGPNLKAVGGNAEPKRSS